MCMAEVMNLEQDSFSGPWILPMVQSEQRQYIVDLRLRQFRELFNPHNYVNFNTEQGKHMCQQTGIVVCQECQMGAIISAALVRDELRCMNCLALIVPRVRL